MGLFKFTPVALQAWPEVRLPQMRFVGLALCLCHFAAEAGSSSASQWFPLQQGNEWVLQSTNDEMRIVSCIQNSGSQWLVRGLLEDDIWFRSNSSANLPGLGPTRHWQNILRFNRRAGMPWTFHRAAD